MKISNPVSGLDMERRAALLEQFGRYIDAIKTKTDYTPGEVIMTLIDCLVGEIENHPAPLERGVMGMSVAIFLEKSFSDEMTLAAEHVNLETPESYNDKSR